MDKHKMIANNEGDELSSSSIPLYAMRLATSSVLPMVLKATVELGVLEILEREGPDAMLYPLQIASKIPGRNNPDAHDMLDKMLSLLASHSILSVSLEKDRQGDGGCKVYDLAPVDEYFLRNREGRSLSDLTFMVQDRVMIDFWFHLKDLALEGGVPFERAHSGAVSWMSKRQSTVALSITEVEYKALTHDAKEVIWMSRLCKELGFTKGRVNIGCDRQSAIFLAKNPAFHARTKHIGIQYHFIREKVEQKAVVLEKVDTQVNSIYFFIKTVIAEKY